MDHKTFNPDRTTASDQEAKQGQTQRRQCGPGMERGTTRLFDVGDGGLELLDLLGLLPVLPAVRADDGLSCGASNTTQMPTATP